MSDEPHKHDWHWAYSRVDHGSYVYDEKGYIYDVLICSRCGQRWEREAATRSRYSDARREVESANAGRRR